MSDNDSSSEDDDYKPSKAEVHEADIEAHKHKRRKVSDAEEAVRLAKVRPRIRQPSRARTERTEI